MRPDKAVVAWMDHGNVRGSFAASMMILQMYSQEKGLLAAAAARHEYGPALDLGRAELQDKFLNQTEADYLLQVDADMHFRYDALERLMKVAQRTPTLNDIPPIVSGLTWLFTHADGQYPAMARRDGEKIRPVWDWPDDEVIDVDVVGGACLLVHRSVFELLGPGAYDRDIIIDGFRQTEDIAFSLHARDAGCRIVVDTSTEFEHTKYGFLNRDSYDRQRRAEIPEVTA